MANKIEWKLISKSANENHYKGVNAAGKTVYKIKTADGEKVKFSSYNVYRSRFKNL